MKTNGLPVAFPVVWSFRGPVEELVVAPLPDNQSKSSVCTSDQLHLSISKLQLPVTKKDNIILHVDISKTLQKWKRLETMQLWEIEHNEA